MRYSSIVIAALFVETALLGLLCLHANVSNSFEKGTLQRKAVLVKQLQLSDLCLFTEARYTRHLSQADLNTAFQDHPISLEHFPSGSFTQPNLYGIRP